MFPKSHRANTSRVVAPLSSSLVRFGLISECLLSTCGSWTRLPCLTVMVSNISSHPGCSTSNCCVNCKAQLSGCNIHSTHNGIRGCVVTFPLGFFFKEVLHCFLVYIYEILFFLAGLIHTVWLGSAHISHRLASSRPLPTSFGRRYTGRSAWDSALLEPSATPHCILPRIMADQMSAVVLNLWVAMTWDWRWTVCDFGNNEKFCNTQKTLRRWTANTTKSWWIF